MDDWGNWRLNFFHAVLLMNKKIQSQYVVALEALKEHGCISAYSIIGDDVDVKWEKNGTDRVMQEFIAKNPKPFGLKRSQRSVLMLVLPPKELEKLDQIIISDLTKRYGLPPTLSAG